MSGEESEIARLQEERALKKASAQKAGDVSLGGRAADADVYRKSDYLTELPAGDPGMDVDDDENTEEQPQRLLDSCESLLRS